MKNTKENFRTDFIFALISRHFIGLSRYFRLWKVMPQIKEPVSNKFNKIELKIQEIIFFFKILNFYLNFQQNSRNWIFILNFHGFFYTSPFIWYISIHHVKYLDKPIKCLEMRAKIKSVRKYLVSNLIILEFDCFLKNNVFLSF